MSDIAVLKSYLVNLGFKVDQPSLSQFTNMLKQTVGLTKSSVASITTDVIKWQGTVISMFTAVSGAVVTMMDKVAMADQGYRLFGERMFMDTAHAKSLKIALDALNEPIEAIAFDRELHGRFVQLQKDQRELIAGLGGGFEQGMRSLRDIRFEFTRFQVELEYFAQGLTLQIFKGLGLGSGDFLQTLRNINDYIIQHIPEWSAKFARYVVPILKDTWRIAIDLVKLFAILANDFTNFIAVVSGDNSLKSKTFDFDKFAGAVEKVADALASVLDGLINVQSWVASHPTLLGAIGGGIAGSMFGPEGTVIGGVVGGGIGALAGLGQSTAAAAVAPASVAGANVDMSALVQSVISQESGGHAGAVSGKGAAGLMQLMPGTARGLGVTNRFDPAQNVAGGTKYLQQLLGKYGDLSTALAAYNWGPGNVDKALKNHLPFSSYPAETQNYVRSVLGKYNRRTGGAGGSQASSVDNSVTIGAIHIAQPGADHEQIARTVVARVREERHAQVQRNLAQLTSVYG